MACHKSQSTKWKTLQIFQEIGRRLGEVKSRAFELFQRRGQMEGSDLEDWFRAEHEILGWPAAELAQRDNAYDLKVTLPGFDAEEVEMTTTPSELVIHAARQHEKKGNEKGVVWTEFGFSDVYRHFALPSKIQLEKVVANLDKGILKITAPMADRSASVTA